MELNLDSKQSTQLELIALYAGKTQVEMLTEAALFLLEHDIDSWEWMRRNASVRGGQKFLGSDELDARLAEMLRR
jgi:hypothetical protein